MSDKVSYTAVVGLGETGFSCVEYLVNQNVPLIVVDTRLEPPALSKLKTIYPEIPVFTGGWPVECLSRATSIVLSPGIARTHPEILKAISVDTEIIGDVELFAQLLTKEALEHHTPQTPVIAITGSNGKSTVTSLVGHMAHTAGIKVAVGGNLGTPVLALQAEFQEKYHRAPELYVLELSSFQLETTYTLKPLVATILNLCPDHLDRYENIEAYRAAKRRIFQNCERAVVNREDNYSNVGVPKGIPIGSFGLKPELTFGMIHFENQDWLARGDVPLLPVSILKILGSHNVANALAALALGEQAGFPIESMLEALSTFTGLAHRAEWVKKERDIVWINDSKGTNVEATTATLTGLSNLITGKWILIAGGMGKNADFSPLQSVVAQYCRAVILIGKEEKTLHDLTELLSSVLPCYYADSMDEAVCLADQHAEPGDGVLLSPACASFDMFKNFSERGEMFKDACHVYRP